MKLQTLQNALDRLMPAVASNVGTEELGDLRIAGKTLRSCDGTLAVQVSLEEDTGVDCRVPAERFSQLIRRLSADSVELASKDGKLTIKAETDGKHKGHLTCEYGARAEAELLDKLNFDPGDFSAVPEGVLESLRLCRLSASGDTSRGPCCGVRLENGAVYGSDGLRISRLSAEELTMPEGGVTVPVEFADSLYNFRDVVDGIAFSENAVFARTKDSTIFSAALVAGDYPDLEKFVEQADGLEFSADLPEGLEADLKRHQAQQADRPDQDREVRVTLTNGKVVLESSDADLYRLTTEMDADGIEDSFSFRIHPASLLGILGRSRRMEYSKDKPFVAFRDGGYLYLTTVESE